MHKIPGACLRAITPLVILAALLVSTASTAAAADGFGDVDDNAYFSEAVTWMIANGITSGIETGCFGPGEPISRGQAAAFLYRLDSATGNGPAVVEHPFTDVVFDYQQDPVGWMYGAGVTTGTSPITFEPDVALTRGDFATLLWRYAGRPSAPAHHFADVDLAYQRAAISWLDAEGITEGTTATTFDPHVVVTRAEAAAMLHRYVDPAEAPPASSSQECSRTLRNALIAGGLTRQEAICATPWLTDFSVEYLFRVVTDAEPASFELILAVAIINDEGCINERRLGELSRLYL